MNTEQETQAILNMGAKITELEKELADAKYRIQELEQQIYGSK